jgi:hypothetical protein
MHISTKQVEPILDGASMSGTKHDTHFTMFSLMHVRHGPFSIFHQPCIIKFNKQPPPRCDSFVTLNRRFILDISSNEKGSISNPSLVLAQLDKSQSIKHVIVNYGPLLEGGKVLHE